MSRKLSIVSAILLFLAVPPAIRCQPSGSWTLWASGLQAGVYPKMAVAPNHDIFYILVGAGGTPGLVYKANTQTSSGTFTVLPTVPLPPSHVNNLECIETNVNSEPLVGIFRNNSTEPWLFRFNNATQTWVAATSSSSPTLGAFTMKRAPNGKIWVGPKWTNVYYSDDNGNTYTGIDESSNIASGYPCYYPTWNGSAYDGAIYGINVDNNGRVYAGTETAGVVYSDDEGSTWHPADLNACKTSNPNQKDTSSPMRPVSYAGNVAGLGFTSGSNLVWSGTNMWQFSGWTNELGFADMTAHSVSHSTGIPAYLITTGQQVSKIVTASEGTMFLHSGGASGASGIGIYTSTNGINWTAFNTGITGSNDGQSEGSLVTDGNLVFMATHDGKVFKYAFAPLAVEETGFSATRAGNQIELRWNTVSEKNNNRFEVERSPDGVSFHNIGTIGGHQNSATLQSYYFPDTRPEPGLNFYRLKQIDNDGTFTYSVMVSARFNTSVDVHILPNPFTDELTISSSLPMQAVKIYDALGRCAWYSVQPDPNTQRIDTAHWKNGVYYAHIILENGDTSTQTILK
jgi:hypothetical protein